MKEKSVDNPNPEPTDQDLKETGEDDATSVIELADVEQSCNNNRVNEQFQFEENRMACGDRVVLDHNTNAEDQLKSLVTKTKYIPNCDASRLPYTSRFWNSQVCASLNDLGPGDISVDMHTPDLTPQGEHTDGGSAEDDVFASELTLASDNQSSLAAASTTTDSSLSSDQVHSDASTLLIRGQNPPTLNQSSDGLNDTYPRLYLPQEPPISARRLSTIEESQPRDDDTVRASPSTSPDDQANPTDLCMENRHHNDLNLPRHLYSRNRHPRTQRTTPPRHANDNIEPKYIIADNSTDEIPTVKIESSPDSKSVNIVSSTGNPASIVLNDRGVSIQVIQYMQPDGTSPKPTDSPLFRGDANGNSTAESASTYDDNQTRVKRPLGDETDNRCGQHISAPRGRCRPTSRGSFPSFHQYPIQETCDGPSWSLPTFK